ncbi:MAG: hypothetical protein IT184_05700 [Acidobacteria bacterium]|nr:hypothetical protein [Acidobacteriota bacterium]
MPDWRALVRQRLRAADLDAADELGIVEELAQHVEDRYADLLREGRTDADALALAVEELGGDEWVGELKDALKRK